MAAMVGIREGLPELGLQIRIGGSLEHAELDFSKLIGTDGHPALIEADPAACIAAIPYASGNTGRPKGAMLSHPNLTANTDSIVIALKLTADDRLLVVLPMFHAFAAAVGMLTPLLHGCGIVPVSRFDPKLLTQAVATHRATVFLRVPTMHGVLLRLDDPAVAQWSGVRYGVSGGAAIPLALMAEFEQRFGFPIAEGGGPTEYSPVTCVNPANGVLKPGSVGLPVPGVEMPILDSDGRELSDGTHGEVYVRGPNVMRGYFNLPDATAESFFGDWFRTGDLGYRDEDGYFYLDDRIKDLILVNGMKVYPRVIEEVLYRHPAFAEAAVVGDPDERHGEIPVAYVVLKPDTAFDPAALRQWCKEFLGGYEVPRRFESDAVLPRNAARKILKRELRCHGERERGVGRR